MKRAKSKPHRVPKVRVPGRGPHGIEDRNPPNARNQRRIAAKIRK